MTSFAPAVFLPLTHTVLTCVCHTAHLCFQAYNCHYGGLLMETQHATINYGNSLYAQEQLERLESFGGCVNLDSLLPNSRDLNHLQSNVMLVLELKFQYTETEFQKVVLQLESIAPFCSIYSLLISVSSLKK